MFLEKCILNGGKRILQEKKELHHPRLNMGEFNFRNWELNATFIEPLCLNDRNAHLRQSSRPSFMKAVELFCVEGQNYLMKVWKLRQNHLIKIIKVYFSAEALKS